MLKRAQNKISYRYNAYGFSGVMMWFAHVAKYLFLREILKKDFYIRKIHDYKLKLDLSDPGIARELAVNGTREDQLRHLLQHEIEEGMTILDIGANIGYYPLMVANLAGDSGFVYAIEPSPSNYQNLIENIELNNKGKNFEVFNMGVSNKKGKERFFLSTHSNLNTFIKDGYKENYTTRGVSDNYIDIEVTDLTSFLQGKKKVDLIRMDVEGYEVEILEGVEEAIRRGLFEGTIIFECHFPKYDEEKHSIGRQLKMLFENGYYVKALTSTDERKSKIRELGYEPTEVIFTGGIKEGVYYNVSNEDALKLITEVGGIRDAVFAKKRSN